jgi:hypothetical protein
MRHIRAGDEQDLGRPPRTSHRTRQTEPNFSALLEVEHRKAQRGHPQRRILREQLGQLDLDRMLVLVRSPIEAEARLSCR